MLFENFFDKFRTQVMNWVSRALISFLFSLGLVSFITHLISRIFLVIYNFIVGIEVSSAIRRVIFFRVLLLSWFSLLFLLVLFWLCFWINIFSLSINSILILIFHFFLLFFVTFVFLLIFTLLFFFLSFRNSSFFFDFFRLLILVHFE